jgi:hypothetical protein
MPYPGTADNQRQIEAVSWYHGDIADDQLQAMKQRQRNGLVTPQQNSGSALPLPSPQPGQSIQQQQQQLPGGITPSSHHRTLSHSSNIQPPVPQMLQQQQQQQQQSQQQQQRPSQEIFSLVQTWSDEHLQKATAAMLGKVAGNQSVRSYIRLTLIARDRLAPRQRLR